MSSSEKDKQEQAQGHEEAAMAAEIAALGEAIKAAKAQGQAKDEWNETLQKMLALKKEYATKFGREFGSSGGSTSDDKKKTTGGAGGNNAGHTESSAKNKEKNALKAQKKAEKEAKKAAQRAEREAREKAKAAKVAQLADASNNCFGDAPLVQSNDNIDDEATGATTKLRRWTPIASLTPALQYSQTQRPVLIRGHLHATRAVGKNAVFGVVRSGLHSVQCVAMITNNNNTKDDSSTNTISPAMIAYMAGCPLESVVDVQGRVVATPKDKPVQGATQNDVEVHVTHFYAVSKTQQALPFTMEDACRPDTEKETAVGEYNEDDDDDVGGGKVGEKIRHDYRWLDLRTPANQSIMRIESMVGCLFRECLLQKHGFTEIHTPKIIGGASEGGSEVFTLDYFGQPACLAMSPQLHKQMTAACSGFERVFETGPVFRAENSNTRRHLCEFTGLDMEMAIHEHYDEILQVFSDLFIAIFDGINERCKTELERVREQHPFEDLQYLRPTLKLTYAEGCALLRQAGVEQGDYDDLSTVNEKKLGNLVKEKYGTDFFFMDKYPLAVRPFYTMPDPNNPKLSNSYDFFIRGQEILSGAQRIHEPGLLKERAQAWDIPLKDIESYVNSFCHGAMPHGGGGIGLERVVMLFLDLPNIRKASWFPRDPKRIAP